MKEEVLRLLRAILTEGAIALSKKAYKDRFTLEGVAMFYVAIQMMDWVARHIKVIQEKGERSDHLELSKRVGLLLMRIDPLCDMLPEEFKFFNEREALHEILEKLQADVAGES